MQGRGDSCTHWCHKTWGAGSGAGLLTFKSGPWSLASAPQPGHMVSQSVGAGNPYKTGPLCRVLPLWLAFLPTRILFFQVKLLPFFSNRNITLAGCQNFTQCQVTRKSQRNLRIMYHPTTYTHSLVRFWHITHTCMYDKILHLLSNSLLLYLITF